MKSAKFSPDEFMRKLYFSTRNEPYKNASSFEDVKKIGENIRMQTKELFAIEKIARNNYELVSVGKPLVYPEYTLQKYSVELCEGLKSAVYILKPKEIQNPAPACVALCGHGYGVRQILNISKGGRKKHFRYFDNYQKSFAAELAKRGCVVAAPELFGFGEARLKKDLRKPFYISSCDELSHHLLPCGLTVASVRILQALACNEILRGFDFVDKNKLSVMGISGGGLTALYASVIDESFSKTVVSGYVNTFKDSILSLWHCPDNYIPGILEIGEIYDFAASIAPRELMIESGKKDKLFPFESSKIAHENIKQVYSLLKADDKLHIDVFEGKHMVNGKRSFDFITEY